MKKRNISQMMVMLVLGTNMVLAQTAFEKVDKDLNEAYKKVMSSLTDEGKKKLRDTQRLWIKYRDNNCAIYSINEQVDCKEHLTIIRTDQILKKEVMYTDEIEHHDDVKYPLSYQYKDQKFFNYKLEASLCDPDAPFCTAEGFFSIYKKNNTLVQVIKLDQLSFTLSDEKTHYIDVFSQVEHGNFSSATISLMDINFDGYQDIIVWINNGAGYMAASYEVYLFNPISNQYIKNKVLCHFLWVGRVDKI